MVRCPNCGTENPEGSAFCGNCGTALTKQAPVVPPVPKPEKKGLPLPVLIGIGALIVLVVCIGGIVVLSSFINNFNSTPTRTVLVFVPTSTVSSGATTPTKSQAGATTPTQSLIEATATRVATSIPQPSATPAVAPSPTVAPSPAPASSPTPGKPNPTPTTGQNNQQTGYVPAGQVIYSDTFADDQGQWDTVFADNQGQSQGQAYIQDNKLHIVVTAPDTSIKSLLNAPGYTLSDFIMEADVTKIAGSDDPYGLVFRRNDANDYYFFGIYDDGRYYLTRHEGKANDWKDLTDLTPSTAIKKGMNVSNRLKVSTRGDEIVMYINDQRVGSVFDGTVSAGKIGFLAGNAGLYVTYGNLKVTSNTIFADDFKNNNAGWAEQEGSYYFKDGEYYLINKLEKGKAVKDLPANFTTPLTDFVFEADMKLRDVPQGAHTDYGIIFRVDDKEDLYFYGITSTGEYFFTKKISDKWTDMRPNTANKYINAKIGMSNRLRAAVSGNTITLYINDQKLDTITDDTLKQGRIGLWLDTVGGQISISRVRVYTP